MRNFTYAKAESAQTAIGLSNRHRETKFLGGGTNLVDLMRENIERPAALIDVTGLATSIEETAGGGLSIGAGVKNTAVASDRRVRERYPFLSQAILFGASGQIRNLATAGGNLLQRTRCGYFYEATAGCNKREPGSGCDALGGFNRGHAVLGWSESCIAVFPSDMCVALSALDATVRVEGAGGARAIPFGEFHKLPGSTPEIENDLRPDELITAIEIPPLEFAGNSLYRKVRDRASYAFALVSVAAALETDNGTVKNVRLALGGVAHKPWRASKAEAYLTGKPAHKDAFRLAAEEEMGAAEGHRDNNFKIELAVRMMVDVLSELAGIEEAK